MYFLPQKSRYNFKFKKLFSKFNCYLSSSGTSYTQYIFLANEMYSLQGTKLNLWINFHSFPLLMCCSPWWIWISYVSWEQAVRDICQPHRRPAGIDLVHLPCLKAVRFLPGSVTCASLKAARHTEEADVPRQTRTRTCKESGSSAGASKARYLHLPLAVSLH